MKSSAGFCLLLTAGCMSGPPRPDERIEQADASPPSPGRRDAARPALPPDGAAMPPPAPPPPLATADTAAGADGAADAEPAATETAEPGSPCPTGAFCDGFDAPTLAAGTWTSVQRGGTVSVDDLKVHRGTRSLHLRVPAGGQSRAYAETRRLPADTSKLWIRFWMYVSPRVPGRPTERNVHQAVMLLYGRNPDGQNVQLEIGFGDDREFVGNFVFFNGGTFVGERAVGSIEKVPAQTWHCLELEVISAGGKVQRRHHLNGVLMTGMINQTYEKPLTFEKVAFGPQQFHPTPVMTDVHVDDVVIAGERVGCGP